MPGPGIAAEQDKGPMSYAEAQAQGLRQNAAGSVDDTLQACLGRIPQDAGTGAADVRGTKLPTSRGQPDKRSAFPDFLRTILGAAAFLVYEEFRW
jgi:hypothetical protein